MPDSLRRESFTGLFAMVLATLLHVPSVYAGQTGGTGTMYVANNLYSATLSVVGDQEMQGSNKTFLLTAQNKNTRAAKDIIIQTRTSSIADLSLYDGDLAVLKPNLPRGGFAIIPIDLRAGETRGSVWAYRHAVSPSGRYLIYESWFPPHGLPEFKRGIILVKELRDSHPVSSNGTARDPFFPPAPSGKPVFPEANLYEASYDPHLEGDYGCISPFLWSDDETRVVFVVFNQEAWGNYLVSIDLALGLEGVVVKRKLLEIQDLAKPGVSLEDVRDRFTDRPFVFAIRQISWGEPGKVILKPYQWYWLPDEIVMGIP